MRRRTQKLTGQAGAIPYFCLNNKTHLISRTPPVAAAASSGDTDGCRQLSTVLDALSVDHHCEDFVHGCAPCIRSLTPFMRNSTHVRLQREQFCQSPERPIVDTNVL